MEITFISAFFVGLFSTVHCIGMCGGIIGALTFEMYKEERAWQPALVDKLKILGEIFGNALARKRSFDSHQNTLKLEALISSISTKFLHIPAERIDDEIENAYKHTKGNYSYKRLVNDIDTLYQRLLSERKLV